MTLDRVRQELYLQQASWTEDLLLLMRQSDVCSQIRKTLQSVKMKIVLLFQ